MSRRVKIRTHEFAMADISRLVHCFKHETLFILGTPNDSAKRKFIVGIGRPIKIMKGQEFDMVKMDFGNGCWRDIIVKSNHARRQIYTLKKGQYAWFYGFMTNYVDNGEFQTSLYARAFQGWFVPKNIDIKKIDPCEIDKLTEENESKINFIDELLKGESDEL